MSTASSLKELVQELENFESLVSAHQAIFYKASKTTNVIEVPGVDLKAFSEAKSSVKGVIDAATLLKAHITKVGIAFKPPISVQPASKTLQDTARIIPALVGSFISLTNDQEKADKIGVLPLIQARELIENVLTSCMGLGVELKILVNNDMRDTPEKPEGTTESGTRLISIGKVWDTCDAVMEISKLQSSKIFAVKAEDYALTIEDALADLKSFIEDGADDGFLFDDGSDFDDDDDEGNDNDDIKENPKTDVNNIDAMSPEQEQAQNLYEQLIKVPDLIRNILIPQMRKNPTQVKLHFIVLQSINKLATSIDDTIVEYMEIDDSEAEALNEKLINKIKLVVKLSGSGNNTQRDEALDKLASDFIEKLSL